jgi:hypothetical protein
MGQSLWSLLSQDKYLRDAKGDKLARAGGTEIAGRPGDKWLEGLSFMTTRRRAAYEERYDIGKEAVPWMLRPTQIGDPDKIQQRVGRSFRQYGQQR